MNGIDVSEHQGDFDFTPYKDGFVIIRGGYGIRNADKWAERNISKCDALGIPWGIYWYSYALNVQTAKLEAERCLRFLNGRKPRLGVWFDMEDADGYKQTNGFPSNETITAMCKTFCAAMEEAGNRTGVYANLDWFENRIGDTGYDKWIAAWGWNDGEHYPDLSGKCVMQQYRGNPLDLDILYVPLSYFASDADPQPSPSASGCHLSQGERQEGDGKCVSVSAMAQEVLDGKWGNGEERKQKLGAWFYDLVQGEVNRILGV